MNEQDFVKLCKNTIADTFYSTSPLLTVADVYVVWLCKTLQNSKALLSTDEPDGMYYECTYNGDKHEMYVDAYVKTEQAVVQV